MILGSEISSSWRDRLLNSWLGGYHGDYAATTHQFFEIPSVCKSLEKFFKSRLNPDAVGKGGELHNWGVLIEHHKKASRGGWYKKMVLLFVCRGRICFSQNGLQQISAPACHSRVSTVFTQERRTKQRDGARQEEYDYVGFLHGLEERKTCDGINDSHWVRSLKCTWQNQRPHFVQTHRLSACFLKKLYFKVNWMHTGTA